MEIFGYCTSSNQLGEPKVQYFYRTLYSLTSTNGCSFFCCWDLGEIFAGYWGFFSRVQLFFLLSCSFFLFPFSLCLCRLIWGVVRNTAVVQLCVAAQLAFFFILLTCVRRCRIWESGVSVVLFFKSCISGATLYNSMGVDFSGLYGLKVGIG